MFKFFSLESKTIIGAASIVGFLSFVSRFVGFIRDRVLAGTFGAGDTLDVYYAAFKIPDFLFSLIVIGAVSSSFIPIFIKHYDSTRRFDAWHFTNKILNLLAVVMLILCIILFIFADPLSGIIAPGFNSVKREAVVQFMRVMLSAQFLLTISMVFGSVLQGLKRFFIYAFAPVLYNVGIIIGALFFTDAFGPIGLAWGVVFGALIHVLVQIIGCVHAGYIYHPLFDYKSEDVKKVIKMTGPRILGIAVSQLLFLILTIIATTMTAGSVTIFQFAYNIQFFAVGIIGVSYAIAAFPIFSEKIHQSDFEGFKTAFSSTIRQTMFFLIPMMILFLILRAQIVRVVVGAGAFDWDSTRQTADTLAFFALTFIPQAFVFILARAFFALHDTVTPMTAGLIGALVGIISAFLFKSYFGIAGLGLAYSLSVIVNAILLWIPLRQRVHSLGESLILRSLMKFSTAGIVCVVVMQGLKPVLTSLFSINTFVGVFSQGLIAGGAGLLAYVFIAWILRTEELIVFVSAMQKRILKKAQVDAPQTLG